MDGYELCETFWPIFSALYLNDQLADSEFDSSSERSDEEYSSDEESLPEGVLPEEKESFLILMDVFDSIGATELILAPEEQVIEPKHILEFANVERFRDDRAYSRPFDSTTWFSRFKIEIQQGQKIIKPNWKTHTISTCGVLSCSKMYNPRNDIQHFCPICERWYHTDCLESAQNSPCSGLTISDDHRDDERLKKLAHAPIVRGCQYPDDWRTVGNGLMAQRIRRWAQSEDELPRWVSMKRELGKLMIREDDEDPVAHTAKRHLELGKNYTDFILKPGNHGQLLQTMLCPICEGII
ncbi:hypothetical protein VKT23_013981 [Stygiomarasmius scandens]|uniref:Uncharacterized protein n=1 Tax=Marasmiellus scandens TaxID=2682957 RepID=A0ABR1J2Y3_9AGAR